LAAILAAETWIGRRGFGLFDGGSGCVGLSIGRCAFDWFKPRLRKTLAGPRDRPVCPSNQEGCAI